MNTKMFFNQSTESFTVRYGKEGKRLLFVFERDGIDNVVDFARRTMVAYRRAVVQKDIPRDKRRTYIESYLSFKLFLKENNLYGSPNPNSA